MIAEEWSLLARLILGALIAAAYSALIILTYQGGDVDVKMCLAPALCGFWLFRGIIGKVFGAAILFAATLGFFDLFLQLGLRALVRGD